MVMALFVNQQNERTELQKRIAAELAEKAKKKSLESDKPLPDGVKDSAYLDNTKKTTRLAWLWMLIILILIVASIWLVAT